MTVQYPTLVAKYIGSGNYHDEATAIAVDAMGNVYVTGESIGSGTLNDYATIKYDSSGTQLWVARYNGSGNNNDKATAIAVDSMGNVYVTGESGGSGTLMIMQRLNMTVQAPSSGLPGIMVLEIIMISRSNSG